MLENNAINAIRILSADMVQKANSGHPGLPLGAATVAYTLWAKEMKHNPYNPQWMDRDRFVLSAGHGSAMLYSLLHLFGYEGMTIEELKKFRQWDSLTPGHPEYKHTTGVEATTGPLGAGLGMAVGMAIAEAHMAAVFNKPGFPIVDHYTYALCGDGCLMEGISSEVLSLAGTLKLGKLIILYDSNEITIEGTTSIAFTENVKKRMEAFGFQVLSVEDGNNVEEISHAIQKAKEDSSRPSFIKVSTTIGFGVPNKENSPSAHGEPLGEQNVKILRKTLEWDTEESFVIPSEIYSHYKKIAENNQEKETRWNEMFKLYGEKYPEMRTLLAKYYANEGIEIEDYWNFEGKDNATRNISGKIINELKNVYTNLMGGSADLGPSNKTIMDGIDFFESNNYLGRNIHFGVRELGMTAIANGMILHGGLKVYISTFLIFADYMKPMIRLAALMKIPLVVVLTHDSIGVGEDGPTHQPVEQLTMLRSTPNVNVFRPADEMETRAAWYTAINSIETPTVLVLSRQNLKDIDSTSLDALKGGYVLEYEKDENIDMLLITSGSEVEVTLKAKEELEKANISTRVVSIPCLDIFEEQSDEYKEKIIPSKVRNRVVIEAGSSMSWGKYVGIDGKYVTMDTFGASAPAKCLFQEYGFTMEHIVEKAKLILGER